MQHIAEQLERIRSRGRTLLLAHRLLQWTAVMLVLAIVLGLVDFFLRLPSGFRLFVDLIVVVFAAGWLATRVGAAARFNPPLSKLALRAEKLFPHLTGMIASGVELSGYEAKYDDDKRTAALAHVTVEAVEQKLEGVPLEKMLNTTPMMRSLAVAMIAVLLFTGIVVSAPQSAMLAAQRWIIPLGAAAWPRRVDINSDVVREVWPSDTPIQLAASVDRGYRRSMRTWVYWRITQPDGSAGRWSSLLMNEQSQDGRFERLIDIPSAVSANAEQPGVLEFYFEAGDDVTLPQQVQLVQRPALIDADVSVTPPAYAQGLVDNQNVDLLAAASAGQVTTISALQGSMVNVNLAFSKPIPARTAAIGKLFPGLSTIENATLKIDSDSKLTKTANLTFQLSDTLQTPINIVDEFGLADLSERLYRFETIVDKPPAISLSQPAADEAVLPTAVVNVKAIGQDDIGVQLVTIEATYNEETKTLTREAGRSARLAAEHVLAISDWGLKPGDELVLTATATDVFNLSDQTHEVVTSSPRRLRVITQPDLVSQLRNELAGLRQQAIRVEASQKLLLDKPAEETLNGQQQISSRLATQKQLVDRIDDRIKRNQLNEPQLSELLKRSDELVSKAQQASDAAQQSLKNAEQSPADAKQLQQEARTKQQEADQALIDLISLLDQGRDALSLQLQLQQLQSTQQALAQQAAELLPKTLGRKPQDLNAEDRKALEDVVDKQLALAEQAQQLTQQMRQTAETMSRQSKDPQDQATAEALSQAANISQRKGLEESMREAGDSAKQNRLSDAGTKQQESLETLQEMLEEVNSQKQRQQEILQRRLLQLVEAIEKLLARQKYELARLNNDQPFDILEAAEATLRTNTIDIAQQTSQSQETATLSKNLNAATEHQADAIVALRQKDKQTAAAGEQLAIEKLELVLEKAQQMQNSAQAEQNRQQRADLRKQYLAMAKEQSAISEETKPYVDRDNLDRRQKLSVINLAKQQRELHEKIRETGSQSKLVDTLLFTHMHERIDDALVDVVRDLTRARATEDVVLNQEIAHLMLQQMAASLEQSEGWDEFDENNPGGGGGGGGQGGGQGQEDLLPATAELQLIRVLMKNIKERTAMIHRSASEVDPKQFERSLQTISVEQRELAGLGERLIEKLRNEQQQRRQPGIPQMIEPQQPGDSGAEPQPDDATEPEGEQP